MNPDDDRRDRILRFLFDRHKATSGLQAVATVDGVVGGAQKVGNLKTGLLAAGGSG